MLPRAIQLSRYVCFAHAEGGRKRSLPNYKRYYATESMQPRAVLARQVYSRLTDADKALADSQRADEISWKAYVRTPGGSPLTNAARYCIEHHKEMFGGSSKDSLRKTALKWFVAFSNEGRLEDVKRRRTLDLEEEDWCFLRDVLVADEYRYTDAANNRRRFPTLAKAKLHWQSIDTTEAHACLERMQELQSRSGLPLLALTQRVRQRFNLTVRTEKFKPARCKIVGRSTCERLLGHTGMVEVLTTGLKATTPKGNIRNVPKSKYIYYRTKLPRYVAAELGREYKHEKLCLDEGAFHIMANIDGCSVFASGDIRFDAHAVHYDVRCQTSIALADVTKSHRMWHTAHAMMCSTLLS